jgi:ankyrin repeat protein
LDDSIDRDSIENFPLASYAAQNWAAHVRVENVPSWIKDGMECLFDADKPHFATWFWIYNKGSYERSTFMRPEKPPAVPLYYATCFGFCDLVEHLVASHPEHINARTRGGKELTPMHIAAMFDYVDIMSLLLENGADVESLDRQIMTPLHRASSGGKLEAVRCLLDHGANINARAVDGRTPLHCAIRNNNTQAARFLLERGADVNARDNDGNTPSHLAEEQEVVELLSEYGTKSVE